MIRVSVGNYPGHVTDYALPKGTTVGEALDEANIEIGNDAEVRVNSEPADLDDELSDGDLVLVSKKAKAA